MPQIDLSHSQDIAIDGEQLLQKIESTIQAIENNTVACHGRVFAAMPFHHSGILLQALLLIYATYFKQVKPCIPNHSTSSSAQAVPRSLRC